MSSIKSFLAAVLLLIVTNACSKTNDNSPVTPTTPSVSDDFFIKAVDASFIPQIRQWGAVTFGKDGTPEDMLTTLQSAGVNTIRLRLWYAPSDGYSGFAEVEKFAKEIKNKGMKVWLSVHYSDSWADPQKQTKPKAWRQLSFNTLKDSVYEYTGRIAAAIRPEYIQIGNEINNGLLWPEGSIQNPDQMLGLLQSGISAVRDKSPKSLIMLHIAGPDEAEPLLSDMQQLDYDIIGLSYYPVWHGKNLLGIEKTLYDIRHQFSKPVVIAETSYPFTLGWNDMTNNIIGSDSQILPDFDASPSGQYEYLSYIHTMMSRLGKQTGYCYWGGEWIAFKGPDATNGSSWENQALWDFDGKVLPAMDVFKN